MRTVGLLTLTGILVAAGLGALYGFLGAQAFDADLDAGSAGFTLIFVPFGVVFGLLLGIGAKNDKTDGL